MAKFEIDSNTEPISAVVGIMGGFVFGASLAVGIVIASGAGAPTAFPQIGCGFNSRSEAEMRRALGVLPRDAVYEACKKAVDNYFRTGASERRSEVIITLPPRPVVVENVSPPTNYIPKN